MLPASSTLKPEHSTMDVIIIARPVPSSVYRTASNESPLSNVASNTTKEASASTMHIASIDMSTGSRSAGPNTFTWAIATVTILDASNNSVQGATVEGHWSELTSDTDSGATGSDGKVALNSDSVKNAAGTFTFTVDNVSLTGWTYDPASNVETSDSISV